MGFAIYEIVVGTGKVAMSPIPSAACDVAEIEAWQPVFVVTLTEPNEGEIADHEGIQWVTAPVKDYGVPEMDNLDVVIARAVTVVAMGGRVLFHCKGGCGRSGMAVLRVMHLMDVTEPLKALRDVRPCAVETQAQLEWALRP